MEPNQCTYLKKYENIHLSVIFQCSMNLKKSKCDILNCTTQGWVYLICKLNFDNALD